MTRLGKVNRVRRQEPKKGLTWCWNCDACLVGDGQKCLVCGTLHKTKRFRKRDGGKTYID